MAIRKTGKCCVLDRSDEQDPVASLESLHRCQLLILEGTSLKGVIQEPTFRGSEKTLNPVMCSARNIRHSNESPRAWFVYCVVIQRLSMKLSGNVKRS